MTPDCEDCVHYALLERGSPKPHFVGACLLHKKGPVYLYSTTVRGYTGQAYCGPEGRHFIAKDKS